MRIVFDYGETIVDEMDEKPSLDLGNTVLSHPSYIAYKVYSLGIIGSEEEFVEVLSRLSDISSRRCEKFLEDRKMSYVFPEERREVLEYLVDDHSLALFTDQVKIWIEESLEYFGIKDFFDDIVVSSELKKEKPHPRGYALVSEGYDDIVMVSDELNDDLVMADKFGMKTVWIHNNYEEVYFEPDYRINDLTEFIDIIEDLDPDSLS